MNLNKFLQTIIINLFIFYSIITLGEDKTLKKNVTHHTAKYKSHAIQSHKKTHPKKVKNKHLTLKIKHVLHVHSATSNFHPYERPSFVSSVKQKLVSFVHGTVSNLRYSAYKLGGKKFDPSHGVYIIDCSTYVDRVLQQVYPHAYTSLVVTSKTEQPTTLQYYDFFKKLANKPKHYWNKINVVDELQPGDIVVFRKKHNIGPGHVMIVMNKPIKNTNNYLVRVADSAPFRHSQDTRLRNVSGIGIGNLLIKVNPQTGQPSAYAWSVKSHWKSNVNFAMARPIDAHLTS